MNVSAGVWGEMVVVPLQRAVQGILADVGALVTDFYSLKKTKAAPKKSNKTEKEKEVASTISPHKTGLVWEGCKVLETIPLDNVAAAALELKKWTDTAKDAMDEMKEVADAQNKEDAPEVEKVKDTHKQEANSDDDADADFDDDFDDDDQWTEEERRVLPGLLLIMRCSYGILNGINSLLEKNVSAPRNAVEGRTQCAWLSELLKHAATLIKHVDELGVCVYPPQKIDLIKDNYKNLDDYIRALLAHVNANEELKSNVRCVKMGEVVHMLLDNAHKQLDPVLVELQQEASSPTTDNNK